MKIIRCEKNDKNCRLVRRNHLIFPNGQKMNAPITNSKRTLFHSFPTKHSEKQHLLTTNENSLSKILYLSTSQETRKESSYSENGENEKDCPNENYSLFKFFSLSKKFFNLNKLVYLTLQNKEFLPKRKKPIELKNFKYNEARADNFESKFSRLLPQIRKKRNKKQVPFYMKKN